MSIKEKRMYNEIIKRRFMDEEYPKSTQVFITYLFYRTEPSETQRRKDIYEMNSEELKSLLSGIRLTSFQSATTIKSILSNYIDWSIKERLNDTGYNLLKTLP